MPCWARRGKNSTAQFLQPCEFGSATYLPADAGGAASSIGSWPSIVVAIHSVEVQQHGLTKESHPTASQYRKTPDSCHLSFLDRERHSEL